MHGPLGGLRDVASQPLLQHTLGLPKCKPKRFMSSSWYTATWGVPSNWDIWRLVYKNKRVVVASVKTRPSSFTRQLATMEEPRTALPPEEGGSPQKSIRFYNDWIHRNARLHFRWSDIRLEVSTRGTRCRIFRWMPFNPKYFARRQRRIWALVNILTCLFLGQLSM